MKSVLTTQNQNSYREQIMKEASARYNWRMKYGKDFPVRVASHKSKPTYAVGNAPEKKEEEEEEKKKEEEKKVEEVKKKEEEKKVKEEAPVPQHALQDVPLMRPVSPQSRQTLYNGLSKEGKGRSQYLKTRIQKMPEERFEYPLLSSWVYGWRLAEYGHEYKSPVNGRSAIIRSTFYARNGIFNVPSATDQLG
ncbi:hypothetical protein Baya_7696 [Bagarius yarrelli]|uniref:Sperm microtubule inner protein 1 C-terminal domain-containing protein n=1 Tax=Bagarius yarrelli TaxID=175774 RepID=A0A556U3Z2_BAGYA|nr:hypothetical protein Baya_7696 [Bagarius yarrelli]